jgi:hypothetical protein
MTPDRERGTPDQSAPLNSIVYQLDAGQRSGPVAVEIAFEVNVRQTAALAVLDRHHEAERFGTGAHQNVAPELRAMSSAVAAEILRPGQRLLARELADDEQAGAA